MAPAQGSVVGVVVDTELDLALDLASHGLISSFRPGLPRSHPTRAGAVPNGKAFFFYDLGGRRSRTVVFLERNLSLREASLHEFEVRSCQKAVTFSRAFRMCPT
jgi:hypothetical protein